MKNKIMKSRYLMGFPIRQRIDNAMFCLSDLSKAYDSLRTHRGWSEKRTTDYFHNKGEQEFIYELLQQLQALPINVGISTFMKEIEITGIIKTLKKYGVYSTKGRGQDKAVYINQYLFMAIALWMNPEFKAHVIIWMTDKLLANRIEAGERYKTLTSVIYKKIIPNTPENRKITVYSDFARLINCKVFGYHGEDLRQIATEVQLDQIKRLQDKITTLIEVGYIKDIQEAYNYLESIDIENM